MTEHQEPPPEPGRVDFFAQLGWAAADHDQNFEPYASMPRERIEELMLEADRAGDDAKWAMLQQFHLDKLSEAELVRHNLTMELATWLIEKFEAHGNAQCAYQSRLAGDVVEAIGKDMPPRS